MLFRQHPSRQNTTLTAQYTYEHKRRTHTHKYMGMDKIAHTRIIRNFRSTSAADGTQRRPTMHRVDGKLDYRTAASTFFNQNEPSWSQCPHCIGTIAARYTARTESACGVQSAQKTSTLRGARLCVAVTNGSLASKRTSRDKSGFAVASSPKRPNV